MGHPRSLRHLWTVLLVAVFSPLPPIATAQEPAERAGTTEATNNLPAPTTGDLSPAPAKVDVNPVARDEEIRQRLQSVIVATGLIGLAFGIAFRDITENFLASIFLSMQRPFETGDLVEITGVTGYVQQLNVRTMILVTLDGNLVQIPNASVYKNNLRNYTTNANRRLDFVIGIGYDDSTDEARELVFPKGIPINMVNGKPEPRDAGPAEPLAAPAPCEEFDAASTEAEGGLASEAEVIKEQARHVPSFGSLALASVRHAPAIYRRDVTPTPRPPSTSRPRSRSAPWAWTAGTTWTYQSDQASLRVFR
jgi:hypothetical protein